MMKPLSVIAAVLFGAAALAVDATGAEPVPQSTISNVYWLAQYTARPGRAAALADWFRENDADLLAKHGGEAIGYLAPADPGPDNEGRLLAITKYRTSDALVKSRRSMTADPRWKRLVGSPNDENAIVATVDVRLGRPTDYAPPFAATQASPPRVFELRTYLSPSPERLELLHERFRDHTMKLFARHGIENLVYWEPLLGHPAQEDVLRRQLFYLLGHKSREAAAASFAAFRQDPDWLAVKKASEDKAGGSLTSPEKGVVSEFFVATEFSPLR